MKTTISLFLFCLSLSVFGITDKYSLTMSLQVPRVYNNTESTGYRRIQTQKITGDMFIEYFTNNTYQISVSNLVNHTHKINGEYVTYECEVDNEGYIWGPQLGYIGNNKTDTFKTPFMFFYMECMPSYVSLDEPDSTLVISLSGVGSSMLKSVYTYNEKGRKVLDYKYRYISYISGNVAGTLGCGCTEYGHKSPTRVAGPFGPTDEAVDISVVKGTWKIKYKERTDFKYFEYFQIYQSL